MTYEQRLVQCGDDSTRYRQVHRNRTHIRGAAGHLEAQSDVYVSPQKACDEPRLSRTEDFPLRTTSPVANFTSACQPTCESLKFCAAQEVYNLTKETARLRCGIVNSLNGGWYGMLSRWRHDTATALVPLRFRQRESAPVAGSPFRNGTRAVSRQ